MNANTSKKLILKSKDDFNINIKDDKQKEINIDANNAANIDANANANSLTESDYKKQLEDIKKEYDLHKKKQQDNIFNITKAFNKEKEDMIKKIDKLTIELKQKDEKIADLEFDEDIKNEFDIYEDYDGNREMEALLANRELNGVNDINTSANISENVNKKPQGKRTIMRDTVKNNTIDPIKLNVVNKNINDINDNASIRNHIPEILNSSNEGNNSDNQDHGNNQDNGDNHNNKPSFSMVVVDGKYIYNNWTDQNKETIKSWKESVSKASFIYEVVLEKYKKRVDYVLIAALLFNTVATLLTAVSTAILATNANLIWVGFGFNVAILLLQAIVTLFNGALKVRGWSDIVTTLSTFIEKIDNFYGTISNELLLPDQLKSDAIEFITKESKNYLNITQQSPNIYPSDYRMANKKYKKFLETEDAGLNFKVAQKYKQKECIIDINGLSNINNNSNNNKYIHGLSSYGTFYKKNN